jgi:hypothetical protein
MATLEDAIRTGLEDVEVIEGEVEEVESSSEDEENEALSTREKAMDEIFATREKQLEEEIGESFNEVDSSEEVEEVREVEVTNDSPIWKDGDNWMTTVKVDGEEVDVEFDSLKSSLQKDKASQKRFEEAAEYGRQIQAREEHLNAYIAKMRQSPSPQQSPPPNDAAPERSEDRSELAKKYHQALYDDNAEEAAELLVKLTNSGRTHGATPNVDQAVQQALNRHMAQQKVQEDRKQQWAYHKSMEDSVHWFNDQYPDIANNSEFRAIADNKTIELQRENPSWSPQDIIKEAADQTREWVERTLPKPKEDIRVRRKKNITSQPKSASASAQIGDSEPDPATVADIIEEMRQSRLKHLQ